MWAPTLPAACAQVVEHNATLALRFKDVSAKQTVPVENEFQPQFAALLAQAAADLPAVSAAWQAVVAHVCTRRL